MFKFTAVIIFACCYLHSTRAAEVCCPGAGCFTDDPPFAAFPLPECNEVINTTMRVFTREDRTVGQLMTRDTIPPIYDGSKMTIFIVHGWTGDESTDWMFLIKDTLLDQGDYNAITVGWGGGAQTIQYGQAASNTRTVGVEIGLAAANAIAQGGSDQARLYCVGKSLGAHVCGHAGMRTKFGRISGLDPAGLMFNGDDWTVGLNPTSADYVDVVHTDGDKAGLMKRLGHVDFYPNGGEDQPGCLTRRRRRAISGQRMLDSCDHQRSVDYYVESILTPCFLSRHTCTDENNLPGSCTAGAVSQSMGFTANEYTAVGIFYLQTTFRSPYCLG